MVVRRKYRAHAPPVADALAMPEPASPNAASAPPTDDDVSPLQRAHDAVVHAEALQKQHQHRAMIGLPEPPVSPEERKTIDAFVDGIASLTDHQKRFLKSHPTLLTEPYVDSMRHAITVARHAGIKDDTDAMDRAILMGVARDVEHHRNLQGLAFAPPPAGPGNAPNDHDIDQHVANLSREAEQHMGDHHMAALRAPPLSSTSQQRKSLPMTAPVSREAPNISGHPGVSNTLTRDEVQIAHVSFPHLSKTDAEYAYLQNKRKLHRMRADGTYSEQRG